MNRQQVMAQLNELQSEMKHEDYAEVKSKIEKATTYDLGYIAFSLRFHKFRVENRDTGGAG